MTDGELSWEEQKHLYNQCVIPLIIVTYSFMAYFVYLMHTNALKLGWDYFIRFGLPLSFIWPTALFLTFEVLYHRKIRRSPMFHMKRFARNMLLVSVSLLSFFAIMIVFDMTFTSALGEKYAFFLSIGVTLLIFGTVVLKLRKSHLRKALE